MNNKYEMEDGEPTWELAGIYACIVMIFLAGITVGVVIGLLFINLFNF